MLYDGSNPADARLDLFSDLWATPVVLCVMGSMFTCAGLLIYFIFYRQMEPGALLIPGGLAVFVVLAYVGAWGFGRDSLYLLKHGESTTGTIVNVNPNIVEFRTKDGKILKYNTNTSSSPPDYSQGERVPILYDPNAPKRAKINSFGDMWFFSAVVGGFATVFLLMVIYCFYARMRQ